MKEVFYNSSVLLVYLAVKYQGDIDKILTAIQFGDINVPYEEAMRVYKALPCQAVTILDYDYPQKLKQAYRPPIVLFYYGDISLLNERLFAVVGSRDMSDYGKQCTEIIVQGLAKKCVIISGLARGIDAAAHECAIKNNGRTIAVLGSGIDNCYPSDNKELYEEIKKHHLLISEYPYDAPPDREHFPMRNRIITGLCDALYIPQINSYMSGTMISLTMGLELGKGIFIAAYPPGSNTINNKLLDEGACFADSAEQICQELGWCDKRKFS